MNEEIAEEIAEATEFPAAATGSVVWVAVVVPTFATPYMGAFSERDDAENWIEDMIEQTGAENASLVAFIVDHPEMTQSEVAVKLGIAEEGEEPQERPSVDVSLTKGQFVDDFSQYSEEQKANLAWQMRRNYQSLLEHVKRASSVLQEAGVEDIAAHVGVEGDDADLLRDLFA